MVKIVPTFTTPPVKRLLAAPSSVGALKLFEELIGRKATPEERMEVEAKFVASAEQRLKY
jgi:hypothetical protein